LFRFLKKRSIRVQFAGLTVFTAFVMVLIVLVFYFKVSSVIADNNSLYTNQIFHQVKQSISSESKRINRTLESIAYNNQVQSYMLETDVRKKYDKFVMVDKLFNNMKEITDGVIDIVVVDDEGSHYFRGYQNPILDAAIKNLPPVANNYYTGKIKCNIEDQPTDCFLVALSVNSIEDKTYLKKLGEIVIILNAKVLGLNMDSASDLGNTDFVLTDKQGNVYSSNVNSLDRAVNIDDYVNNAPGSYNIKSDNMKYILNTDVIPEIGGRIISIVSEKKLYHDLDWIRSLTMIVLFFAAGLLIIPLIVIINNILRPMKKFMDFISTVKSSESLKNTIQLEGYKEIEIMSGEFNTLLSEIDTLTYKLVDTNTKLYETELEKKESELLYLKNQINPHFLYNTLETIKGCAVEEQAQKTLGMTKALGKIFRYSVKGGDIVLLWEELEVTKSYVHIQEIRFSDKLQITYDFTEQAENCKIPKLILQPIVENAISHGLEPKLGKACLRIGGKVDDEGNLLLWVEDDGVGMSQDTLKEIQMYLTQSSGITKNAENRTIGIGLVNVNRRIKLHYGQNYGLEIKSTLDEGTEVTIRIPTSDKTAAEKSI